ncbi:hypothetical protein [Aurantivibrio infirmus]
MFNELIENYKVKKAIKKWKNSSIGGALVKHSQDFFSNSGYLSHFTEENKQNIILDLYQKVFELSDKENPFLSMRKILADSVCGYAQYKVLCVTEEEKSTQFYSDCPYVSCELKNKLIEYSAYDDELGELVWKDNSFTSEDLISFCNVRSIVYLYYVNGLNYVRAEFKDVDNQKDWFRPFIKAMLIWEEEQVRKKLKLPSLLPNTLDALRYSTFMNMVISGDKNPYYEFEKEWSSELTNV